MAYISTWMGDPLSSSPAMAFREIFSSFTFHLIILTALFWTVTMHPLDNQIGQLPLPKEEHVQELTKSEHQPDQSDNGCMERIKTFFYEGCYSFLKFIVGSIISIKVPESTLIPTTDTDITVTTETLIATTSLPEDYEEEVNELKLLLDITSSLLQAGEEIMQMTGKQRDLQPQQQNNAANNQKKQENYQSKSESDSTMNQVWTKEDIEHRRSLRVIRSPTDTFECRNFTSYCTLVIHKRQLQILGNGVEALIKLLNETETKNETCDQHSTKKKDRGQSCFTEFERIHQSLKEQKWNLTMPSVQQLLLNLSCILKFSHQLTVAKTGGYFNITRQIKIILENVHLGVFRTLCLLRQHSYKHGHEEDLIDYKSECTVGWGDENMCLKARLIDSLRGYMRRLHKINPVNRQSTP